VSRTAPAEGGDIQGLAVFAYGKLTEACYILARIKDAASARVWCAEAPVSKAIPLPNAPDTAMQLAFTAEGLRVLGVAASVMAGFSSEFLSGIAGEENRSRRLGDIGASDPRYWRWGKPDANPHIAVLLYAKASLEAWKRTVLGERWKDAFETIACLDTSNMGDREPFGFHDGISQPEIDWDGRRVPGGDEICYGNIVSMGEFLLGYPNEYGKFTDRPLLRKEDDPENDLPAAEDDPASRDLGRNGSYLVLRQLEQDVRGFWQFLDRVANGDAQERYKLGAAIVGRSRAGDPLMPDTSGVIAGVSDVPGQPRNRFLYDSDPAGVRCPLGTHIRRANPRNADLPGNPRGPIAKLLKCLGIPRPQFGEDLTASTRFHRILRRGREYGVKLDPELALQPGSPDERPRGLHFACINANIERQFEFVQNAWLMSSKFDGLTGESDSLLGNREPVGGRDASGFSIQREGRPARRIQDVPRFVTVRGGAYFFLPGIRALQWLARGYGQRK
jgi:deferrochelatase/peroxidase EfeB